MAKLKGMTSLEIAIIVAIVLVIAIAVGWYLYTTFAAAGQQSGLTVTQATIYVQSGGAPMLVASVVPQGAAQVQIQSIEVAGVKYDCQQDPNAVIQRPTTIQVQLSNLNVQVGQVITGRIVLTSGAISPFTATVVAGTPPSGTQLTTLSNCKSS